MAISYPLNDALTLTPQPRRMDLRSLDLVTSSVSNFTGEVQTYLNSGVGRWAVQLNFPPMSRAQAMQWIGLFSAVYGGFGSLILPIYFQTAIRGSGAGTPVVDGIIQAPNTSVAVRGMTPSANGVFLIGDMINIGSDLFRVVRQLDADGSGNGTMEIWPSLRKATTDGQTIVTADVAGRFRTAPGFVLDESIDSAQLWGFGWDGIEAI